MFDKYTIDATRAIFYARLEASREGTSSISTLQLLLGLIREADSPVNQLFNLKESEAILRSGLSHDKEPIAGSVDLPVSDEFGRALEYAQEEASSAGSDMIGSEHLLLGILREKDITGVALETLGLSLDTARQIIRTKTVTRPTGNVYFEPLPFEFDELK